MTGGIFLSRDEMSPEQRLAFDLGHAAATAQAEERVKQAEAALHSLRQRAIPRGSTYVGKEASRIAELQRSLKDAVDEAKALREALWFYREWAGHDLVDGEHRHPGEPPRCPGCVADSLLQRERQAGPT